MNNKLFEALNNNPEKAADLIERCWPTTKDSNYWKTKGTWIESKSRLKINYTKDFYYSEEDYRKKQQEIRELMELNMVLYGKW